MGAFDWLTGTEAETEVISTLNPEQEQLFTNLFQFINRGVGQGSRAFGPTGYPTSAGDYWWTAGPTSQEQAGLGRLSEYVGGTYQNPFAGYLSDFMQGASPEYMTNWYRQYMQPAMERQFTQDILPGIKESFVGPGTFHGTPRANAMARAYGDFGAQLQQGLGQAIMSGRQQAMQMTPYAMQEGRYAAEDPLRRAQAGLQYGGLERQLRQQEINARLQEFIRTSPEYAPYIQAALNMLNIQTQAIMQTPGTQGLAGPLIQAAGTVLGGPIGNVVAGALGNSFGVKPADTMPSEFVGWGGAGAGPGGSSAYGLGW